MARIYGNTYEVCVPSSLQRYETYIKRFIITSIASYVAVRFFFAYQKKFNEMARIYGNIYVVYVPSSLSRQVLDINYLSISLLRGHSEVLSLFSLPIIKKVLHEMARIYGNTYIVCVPSSISRE